MGELYRLEFSNGKSYIGMTTKTSKRRFRGHAERALAGARTPLYDAWRKLGPPTLITLAIVEDRDLPETERRAVSAFGTLVPRGYNVTPGGDFPPTTLPEVAAKLLGNKHALGFRHERSDEYRAKVSAALLGNKNAIGNCHGIGNKNASGKRSAQACANIAAGVAAAKLKKGTS